MTITGVEMSKIKSTAGANNLITAFKKWFVPVFIFTDKLIAASHLYIISFTWAVAALLFYWAVVQDFNPVLSMHFSSLKLITPPSSKIANEVQYKIEACVVKTVNITFNPVYSDDLVLQAQDYSQIFKKGCSIIQTQFVIPNELPAGNYVYSENMVVPLNPLKKFSFSRDVFFINIIDPNKGVYKIHFMHN